MNVLSTALATGLLVSAACVFQVPRGSFREDHSKGFISSLDLLGANKSLIRFTLKLSLV